MNSHLSFEGLSQSVEEIHDLMDFFQEVFDGENRTVSDLLSNTLLFYCYLPAVVGSISCESKPVIALSTA